MIMNMKETVQPTYLFVQPLGAWRKANIREKKTRIVEWAEEIKELVDCDFPDAEKIILLWITSTPIPRALFMKDLIPGKLKGWRID